MNRAPFALAAAVVCAGAASVGAAPAFSNQTNNAQLNASQQPIFGGGNGPGFLAGGAVGDFNNDGFQDIFFPVGGGSPDRLFINNGDGTFTNQAAAYGVALTHRSTAAAVADYNNDGWLDIFETSLGPASNNAPGANKLYRNNGDGTFTNVAATAGVAFASPTVPDGFGAAWGDYDLDGDLDLAVSGWFSASANRIFRNNGDGTFTDVTIAIGASTILSNLNGFSPRFADMNGDRYPEINWVGDFGTSRYLVNDGDGTFTNRTNTAGMAQDGTEMGSTIADFNRNGLFDIYVTTISSNNLYMNNGNNTFTNRASTAGVTNTGWGWGTVAIDFDHDTKVDIVATTQSGRQWAFRNMGNNASNVPQFQDVTSASGLSSNLSGRGLANFDYDNDGDQDLVFFMRSGPLTLFRNDQSGANNNWIRVFLDGSGVDDIPPNGIGSVVKVTIGSTTLMGRVDGGSNFLSQSELSAHFGLGGAGVIDELRVEWSNGDVTVMTNVPVNQTLNIAAAPANIADLNGDGVVNGADLAILLIGWGGAGPADFNNDGVVNGADLATLLTNWG